MPHGRYLLLQNLHFHHPWWSDTASERTWTYLQRVSGDGLQFMSRIAKIQDLPGRARLVDSVHWTFAVGSTDLFRVIDLIRGSLS